MRKFITPVEENYHKRDYTAAGFSFGVLKEVADSDLINNEKLKNLLKFGIVKIISISGDSPQLNVDSPSKRKSKRNQ